jgi:tRNA (guanine26-N2/guanine27-N2)-dimethyltransferase
LRTAYCHELAVRLLAGCLTMMAAKHDLGIRVVFSHSTDHYVRVYAVARYGAKRADKSVQKMGYILHCFTCLHRETSSGIFSSLKKNCPECGSEMSTAGPLWLGEIFDEKLSALMERELKRRSLRNQKAILKMLSRSRDETKVPPTYYITDKICDKLNLPIPPLIEVMKKLRKAGFQAVPTHFNSRGIRTNAPASVVRLIISSLSSSK